MWDVFKSKTRKKLEVKDDQLFRLKLEIDQLKKWCAYDSPEIGYAMMHLKNLVDKPQCISSFREKLRKGKYTWDNFKKEVED
jgi:hypothetical protein